jgi:hypothetical protein
MKFSGYEPVGLANEYHVFFEKFHLVAGIRLDRLLKQRSALRESEFSFDFPPPRDEFSSSFRTLILSPTNS